MWRVLNLRYDSLFHSPSSATCLISFFEPVASLKRLFGLYHGKQNSSLAAPAVEGGLLRAISVGMPLHQLQSHDCTIYHCGPLHPHLSPTSTKRRVDLYHCQAIVMARLLFVFP